MAYSAAVRRPDAGPIGLKLHPARQRANHQPDQQHHQKRQEVLRIADRERQPRRDEKKSNAATPSNDARIDGPRPNPQATTSRPAVYHGQVGRIDGRPCRLCQPTSRAKQHHGHSPEIPARRGATRRADRAGRGRSGSPLMT